MAIGQQHLFLDDDDDDDDDDKEEDEEEEEAIENWVCGNLLEEYISMLIFLGKKNHCRWNRVALLDHYPRNIVK